MSVWRSIKMLLTLKCEESARLMSDATTRKLTPTERWAVRLHQISCRFCRRLAKQLDAIDRATRSRVESPAQLADSARDRIAASLRNEPDSDS